MEDQVAKTCQLKERVFGGYAGSSRTVDEISPAPAAQTCARYFAVLNAPRRAGCRHWQVDGPTLLLVSPYSKKSNVFFSVGFFLLRTAKGSLFFFLPFFQLVF